ncbi:MAG: HutP family protein [Bacillota bacterium]|jgi:hypothetical protein
MIPMGSKRVATVAIKMALTESREEERELKKCFLEQGIRTAAVDYGGEFLSSVGKVIERAVVAAKREGVIKDTHPDEGAVAGATHEALSQIMPKGIGLNIGGKIGIARYNDHISVAVFFGIGMIHLDEVAIGLAHRAVL